MSGATKIFYNKSNRKTYAKRGNKYYEHIDGKEWKEAAPKMPMRVLHAAIYSRLYESFHMSGN